MPEPWKLTDIWIKPREIKLRHGEKIQLTVNGTKPDGSEVNLMAPIWSCYSGGFVTARGELTAKDVPGVFKVECATSCPGDNEKILLRDEVEFEVLPLEESEIKAIDTGAVMPTPKLKPFSPERSQKFQGIKDSLRKRSDEELREITKKNEYVPKGPGRHTRAFVRTVQGNPDLMWLSVLVSSAVYTGIKFYQTAGDFSLENIASAVVGFMTAIISLYGKLHTPPGSIANSCTSRIKKKDHEIDAYGYTIDENYRGE